MYISNPKILNHSTFLGLMGNFNDDPSDDLMYRDETLILSDSTEAEIFELGKSWAVDPAKSHFTSGGETAETYGDPSFTPL